MACSTQLGVPTGLVFTWMFTGALQLSTFIFELYLNNSTAYFRLDLTQNPPKWTKLYNQQAMAEDEPRARSLTPSCGNFINFAPFYFADIGMNSVCMTTKFLYWEAEHRSWPKGKLVEV